MIRKLCNLDRLPSEGKLKAFVGQGGDSPLALCLGVIDGTPYAVDNACPHQGAPLAAGHIEEGYVVCPVHCWRFRLADGMPAHSGDPAVPSYEVRCLGHEVFVRIRSAKSITKS